MQNQTSTPRVAIACGGTGGHLYPGMAVAEQLRRRGCAVTLLISPKEVDQQAVRAATDVQVVTLPAAGLRRGGAISFARGNFARSCTGRAENSSRRTVRRRCSPWAVSSAPRRSWRARIMGAPAFLHESNTIPGRANRWLSLDRATRRSSDFPGSGRRGCTRKTSRPPALRSARSFNPATPRPAARALGLDPARPVVLVTGGSQGASGLNDLVIQTLPLLARLAPDLQLLHLTGPNDAARVEAGVRGPPAPDGGGAVLLCGNAHGALGAATAWSSAARARRRWRNSPRCVFRQSSFRIPPRRTITNFTTPRPLKNPARPGCWNSGTPGPKRSRPWVAELAVNPALRATMQAAQAQWHSPRAAEQIAEHLMLAIADGRRRGGPRGVAPPAWNTVNPQFHEPA